MKKSLLPVAFAAAMSLAACGGGSKAAQSAISLNPSSTASHAAPTSTSSAPTSTSSHAASTATSAAVPTVTKTVNKPAVVAPVAPARSATSQANNAPAAAKPTPGAPIPPKSAVTPATPATKVSKVWPGAGWKIQTANTDLCNMGMGVNSANPSGFSADTFTCGPTAASLLACKKDASGYALCIQDYTNRIAVRFKTRATVSGSAPSPTAPLAVKLSNGMTCSADSHDQSPHYEGRHGWLACDNGGRLLLPKGSGDMGDTGNYFNKSGSTWTAQLGMGTNAPTTVKVAQVFYAQ